MTDPHRAKGRPPASASHCEDSEEETDADKQLASLLEKYDQLTDSNEDAGAVFHQATDLGLLDDFKDAQKCVELIGQIWPHTELSKDPGVTSRDSIASTRDDPPKVLQRRLGRFEILRELGRGGGGIVYLAFDPRLDRKVALKVPHPEFVFAEDLRRRFFQEASLAAQLHHPGIATVHEIGELGVVWYIVSEYCSGPTLSSWLESETKPIDSRTAASIMTMLADAVQHAHDRGILHRDLKPSNVLLDRSPTAPRTPPVSVSSQGSAEDRLGGIPKLTDFGLATSIASKTTMTRTGSILGTPAYMSPEQADGLHEEIGPGTDIYALGVMLYEMLTGRVPFFSDTDVSTLRQIVYDEPKSPRRHCKDISRDLAAICLKCLEKKPANRYHSAAALADDLRRFLTGFPTHARPASAIKRLRKWCRRQPAQASLVIMVLIFLAIVFGLSQSHRNDLHQARQDAALVATQLRQETSQNQRLKSRHQYVDHMRDAYTAWKNSQVDLALKLLDDCRPRDGEDDQRDFEWYYVRRLCDGGLWRSTGHGARAIHGTSFSPDGSQLATGADDGSVHVWNADTGQLVDTFQSHATQIVDITYSPDGRYLATVGDQEGIKLWDASTFDLVRVYRPSSIRSKCVAFSRDSTSIAVGGEGGRITVWSLDDEADTFELDAGCDVIYALDFSTDDCLAAACSDQSARIWDLTLPSAPCKALRTPSMKRVYSIAFSPDGKRLGTAGDFIHIWDLRFDDPPIWLQGPGHQKLAFSCDGRLLATSGGGEHVYVWDVATTSVKNVFSAHQRRVLDLAFSSQTNELASVDREGTVVLWNADNPQDRRPLPMELHETDVALAFSPIADSLAIAKSGKGEVQLWNVRADGTAKYLSKYASDVDQETTPNCIEFSPSGRLLNVATDKDRIVLDENLKPIATQALDLGLANVVSKTAFSSKVVIAEATSGDTGNKVRIVDPRSARVVAELNGNRAVAFSPSGEVLAMQSGSGLFLMELWDFSASRSLAILEGHTGNIVDIVFSRDGQMIASGDDFGTVILWDAVRRQALRTMPSSAGAIVQVAFSPDQKSVVSSGTDGTIRFWDVLTGRPLLELAVTSAVLRSFSFSAGGDILATAHLTADSPFEGRVNLWCAPRNER